MSAITAELVRQLREKSGAGMMDCKKALQENGGDLEASVDWLRKKGLAAAAKKAGRIAAEGLVAIATSGPKGVVVEVNSETDFVGRNEHFQNFVKECATQALKLSSFETSALSEAPCTVGEAPKIGEELTRLVATIGENMSLRRLTSLEVSQGCVVPYMHNQVALNLGKIGVLVALESNASNEALTELGKKIAMHIAATNPQSLSVEDLDAQSVERERNVIADQARASGRPEDIIQKMVEGRLRKFYEEVVLLEQSFVMDPSLQVKAVIEQAAKDLGTPVTLKGYIRYALGEGIEKAASDFAAEV
ncbi:MAG TPA: translation elongation factor Ts, partial [Alphaproteobacteria bacterium]|nr:translation elongation factor Ts [Alphaproteobacteria bacterium]